METRYIHEKTGKYYHRIQRIPNIVLMFII